MPPTVQLAAEFFARNGYLTLAPDFRSWGESDNGLSLFHTGLVADVLNLISSIPSIPEADPQFLQQVSPLYYLEYIYIDAPLQIDIGTADGQTLVQTPPEWSAKLAESLQAANHDVTYFTYPGQGHSYFGESWTLLLERAILFYQEHLGA